MVTMKNMRYRQSRTVSCTAKHGSSLITHFMEVVKMEQMRDLIQERIIRKAELLAMVGLSDPTIWRMERDGKFPKRIRLGGNSCGWLQTEVNGWFADRAAAR